MSYDTAGNWISEFVLCGCGKQDTAGNCLHTRDSSALSILHQTNAAQPTAQHRAAVQINNSTWKGCGHPVYLKTSHCNLCCNGEVRGELLEALKHAQEATRFFASVIKSGERWSVTCQEALEQLQHDDAELNNTA